MTRTAQVADGAVAGALAVVRHARLPDRKRPGSQFQFIESKAWEGRDRALPIDALSGRVYEILGETQLVFAEGELSKFRKSQNGTFEGTFSIDGVELRAKGTWRGGARTHQKCPWKVELFVDFEIGDEKQSRPVNSKIDFAFAAILQGRATVMDNDIPLDK